MHLGPVRLQYHAGTVLVFEQDSLVDTACMTEPLGN